MGYQAKTELSTQPFPLGILPACQRQNENGADEGTFYADTQTRRSPGCLPSSRLCSPWIPVAGCGLGQQNRYAHYCSAFLQSARGSIPLREGRAFDTDFFLRLTWAGFVAVCLYPRQHLAGGNDPVSGFDAPGLGRAVGVVRVVECVFVVREHLHHVRVFHNLDQKSRNRRGAVGVSIDHHGFARILVENSASSSPRLHPLLLAGREESRHHHLTNSRGDPTRQAKHFPCKACELKLRYAGSCITHGTDSPARAASHDGLVVREQFKLATQPTVGSPGCAKKSTTNAGSTRISIKRRSRKGSARSRNVFATF